MSGFGLTIEGLDGLHDFLMQGVVDETNSLVDKTIELAKENTPIGETKELINSYVAKHATIQDLEAEVENTSDHAIYVELGTVNIEARNMLGNAALAALNTGDDK